MSFTATETDLAAIELETAAACRGDSTAMAALIGRFAPAIEKAAGRNVAHADSREDARQEACLVFIELIQSGKPARQAAGLLAQRTSDAVAERSGSSLSAGTGRLARRIDRAMQDGRSLTEARASVPGASSISDETLRTWQATQHTSSLDVALEVASNSAAEIDALASRMAVEAVLSQLDSTEREIFTLKLSEISDGAIATQMQMSRSAVQRVVSAVRDRLSAALDYRPTVQRLPKPSKLKVTIARIQELSSAETLAAFQAMASGWIAPAADVVYCAEAPVETDDAETVDAEEAQQVASQAAPRLTSARMTAAQVDAQRLRAAWPLPRSSTPSPHAGYNYRRGQVVIRHVVTARRVTRPRPDRSAEVARSA